jgi:hypothetical protein
LADALSAGTALVVRGGIEVRAPGTLDVQVPWVLPRGEAPGAGTVRAGGAAVVLRAGESLSVRQGIASGFTPPFADPSADARSWLPSDSATGSIRLVAGADLDAAAVRGTKAPALVERGRLVLGDALLPATPSLVRATDARVELHAGSDIVFATPSSAAYTTGLPVASLPAGAPDLQFTPLVQELVPDPERGYVQPFLDAGGGVELSARGDVIGPAADPVRPYLFTDWWWRGPAIDQALWWSRFDRFGGGAATFGGGDVTVSAGGRVVDLVAAAAGSGWMPLAGLAASTARYGGGAVSVDAGADIVRGSVAVTDGPVDLRAGRRIGAEAGTAADAPDVVYGDGAVRLASRGDATLARLRTAGQTAPSLANLSGSVVLGGLDADATLRWTSAAGSIASLSQGQVGSSDELRDNAWSALGGSLPGDAFVAAPGGSATLGGSADQRPTTPQARLQALAGDSLTVGTLTVGAGGRAVPPAADAAIAVVEQRALDVFSLPAEGGRSLDLTRRDPVQLAARDGDLRVTGVVQSARALRATAGRDIALDGPGQIVVQHQPERLDGIAPAPVSELTLLQAGRDITAARSTGGVDGIAVAGPGDVVLLAGRDIDLGASAGVVAIGNQRNGTLLPAGAAALWLAAGVRLDGRDLADAAAGGFAVTGTQGLVQRSGMLWAWLTGGDSALDSAAAREFDALDGPARAARVAEWLGDAWAPALARALRRTLALGMTPERAQRFVAEQTPLLLDDPLLAPDVLRLQQAAPGERAAVAMALLRETRVRERVELSLYARAVLAAEIDAGNAPGLVATATPALRDALTAAVLADAWQARPAGERRTVVAAQVAQLQDTEPQRLDAWLQAWAAVPGRFDADGAARIAERLGLPATTSPVEVQRAWSQLPPDARLAALDADDQSAWRGLPDQRWLEAAREASTYVARVSGLDVPPPQAATAVAALPRERQLPLLAGALRADLLEAGQSASGLGGEAFDAANAAGYHSLDMLFPLAARGDGSAADAGSIRTPTSQVRTVQTAPITLLAPTGGVNAGELVPGLVTKRPGELGIVTVAGGDIFAAVRDSFEVNQSRVFTLAAGDILLWASDGNVDAGRGAKTVTGAPAPQLRLDANGNLVLDTSGSFAGSGIATLDAASAVSLFAPRGEVNAGEAGISAAGNITIAAARVVGADNIAAGGSFAGAPVVPAAGGGALSALAGATNAATAAAASATADDEEDRRRRERRRQLILDFLGFGAGE